MEEQIRNAIHKAMQEISDMQGKLEELVDELPKEAENIRARAMESMVKIREQLDTALKRGESQAKEAQLQAHLGLMEAHDKLDASRTVMNEYLTQAMSRSKTLIDEAELKRHLATMEAQDFWESRGKHLSEQFQQSQDFMMDMTNRAAADLQSQFKQWNAFFQKSGQTWGQMASGAMSGAEAEAADKPKSGSKKTASKKATSS